MDLHDIERNEKWLRGSCTSTTEKIQRNKTHEYDSMYVSILV